MRRVLMTIAVLFVATPLWAQVPNYRADVETCVTKYAAAWACLNEERACKLDFIILCARDITRKDPRVGLNGKRGDPGNLSADVLDFRGVGGTTDSRTGQPLAIVDVAYASDSPQRRPDWNQHDVGPGTWVDPFSVQPSQGGGEPPPPPPPPPPGGDPISRALKQIDDMHAWLLEIVTFVRKLQGQ